MSHFKGISLFGRFLKLNHDITQRSFSTTARLAGSPHGEDPIKNFEQFKWPNKVSTFEHHKLPQELLDNEFNYPVCRDTMGIRWPGYWFKRKFVYVKEMEPEIVVPDLRVFELKPYVSYRADEIDTKPFTAKDLFDAVYKDKIVNDFEQNNVEDYTVEQEEIDKARLEAMQTGSDLFEEDPLDGVRAPLTHSQEL